MEGYGNLKWNGGSIVPCEGAPNLSGHVPVYNQKLGIFPVWNLKI